MKKKNEVESKKHRDTKKSTKERPKPEIRSKNK